MRHPVKAIGAIVSPLFVGLIADRFFAAQRMLSVLHLLSAACLVGAGFHVGRSHICRLLIGDGGAKPAVGAMMARYAQFSRDLCVLLLGDFASRLDIARTSFRPVEIEGRKARTVGSDDTLLHVDAFSSRPMAGRRILRVFTNVNPVGKPRVWNVGEPFDDLARRFVPRMRKPWPGERAALRLLYVTKSYRTLYDHYMLRLHDDMKGDAEYQRTVPHVRVELAAGATWMCFTDQVSHAALTGQHVLEQTFYGDVEHMTRPEHSPLKVLESLVQQPLV